MTPSPDYLDLLESVLCFSLWPEPLRPVWATADRGLTISLLRVIDRLIRPTRLALAIVPAPYQQSSLGTFWPALAFTMIGQKRLRNIRELCQIVDGEGVPGSFVECGVWRGGASIYARACLDLSRVVYVCDSFDGLPPNKDEPEYAGFDFLKVPMDVVVSNFLKFGQAHNVVFRKGWFKDTLPHVPGPIAILRADGDMYSSTMDILCNLYPKVSPGGFVIIDDWGWLPRCREAVEAFRHDYLVVDPIQEIDGIGVFWRKSA